MRDNTSGSSPVLNEHGPDLGAPWHYGSPMVEQRELAQGRGSVDRSHRPVITVAGPDRLGWLHSLSTQHLEQLAPGVATTALLLSPHGHVEHVMYGVDDGETFWLHTEPGRAAELVQFLDSMRFMMRVEVTDRSDEYGLVWRPGPAPVGDDPPTGAVVRTASAAAPLPDLLGGHEVIVPQSAVPEALTEPPAGTWAYEALRIAAGVARVGVDTDARTLPNEAGFLDGAVHLDKGCYRGQETVARVHNLGRPPRRLVLLHLDGSVEQLPEVGAPLTVGDPTGRPIGVVGSSARHHELGPIALGLVKRNVPVTDTLLSGEIAAGQEVLVDPEIGLHVKARL
ncbi:YgfZ/GcvT domain-containing protein [Microlunatus sp. Y2014]|uniref:CAF17-like 4Fe-4S cluster assembly/insertion protein YgfZ n=1 Tax=Microlunatus sp. Y2014 TaxID=3418488 RepID=UPI003DA718A5